MDTVPVKEARECLVDLISFATKNRCHYQITSEEGNVVLMPEETYNNILITLELLSTPGLLDGITDKDAFACSTGG